VNFGNAAGGTLSINPAPDKPWIDAWVMTPGELRRILVGVNPAGMAPGYYTGVVRLNKGAGGDPLIGRSQCIRVETWVMPADADVASSLLVVSPHTINVAEGKRGISYNVSLGAAPRLANVTVTPNGNTSQLSVSPTSLTFSSANWNVPQQFTMTPVDDKLVEGLQTLVVLHSATGAAPWNGANLPGVVVNIADNDAAGVYITPASVTVREAGPAAEYSVVLMSQPTADVRVAPSAPAPVGVSPALLTFTPANWNVAQKFRVSAANDGITNGTRTVKISHSVSSNDTNYPTSMDVAVVDIIVNDVPDVSHQFMPLMMHGGRR
jgi:hypothetical protein